MAPAVDLAPALEFLKRLKRHNNRDWFGDHRADYETAMGSFEEYVGVLLDRLATTDRLGGVSPKDCIFRLHRDLRFSKDKSPYKTHFGAYLAPGGRKSRRLGYYIHVEPGNASMLAGGLHEPEPGQLAAFRRAVDRNPGPLTKILGDPGFRRTFGGLVGDKLSTAPKGYPRDHPQVELLKLKQPTVVHRLTDAEVLRSNLVTATLRVLEVMRPFLRYLDALE
jgi:uncharacterized protein (TIGR02453 family)